MKTYHWNGENWYKRDWSILHRIRCWLIWVGGWEKANGAGWAPFIKFINGKRKLRDITPISFFGHRITFFGWGGQIRYRGQYLVWTREDGYWEIFISPNGTPSRAIMWLRGVPYPILHAIETGQSGNVTL